MAARPRQAKRRNWPANLNQNGAGYFYWRDPDTKKDYGLGRDQAKAFQEARAANAEVSKRRGHTTLVERISLPAGKSLAEWAPSYLETYIATRKPAASTLSVTKSVMRAILTAPFADKPLTAIETRDIAEFISTTSVGRGMSMARHVRQGLHDMFREAEMAGLIGRGMNPVSITRIPKAQVGRARLTLDQFRAIYAKALERQPWVARSMELAMLTAQRREDIAHMQFSDVKDGFLFVTQGKTGMKLRIPTAVRIDVLGLSLDDVIKRCRDGVVSKWFLHHTESIGHAKPGQPIQVSRLSRAFAAVRDNAEVEWETGKTPASFHEMRSLAARLYADQHSPDFAQSILGHKSADMTAVYRDVRGAEWVEVKVAS